MAENLYYDKIDRNVDWGGDVNTGNLPVAGSAVQEFIKSELASKVGSIYQDDVSGRYLCFAHNDARDAYLLDRSKEDLIIASFIAPSNYKAKINVDSYYNAVLINSKENYLTFGYEITHSGEEFVDNIRYIISVTKNGKTHTINGTGVYGKSISVNIDEFMQLEGTTEISIVITGQTTNATASTIITYEVVNLLFSADADISKEINLNSDVIDPFVINYSIFGTSNIKYIDWYVDGKFLETDTIQGGTAEEVVDNKRISAIGLSHGVHNVQFRAYVAVNGENFYTDTIYKEFAVVSDKTNIDPLITIETIIPKRIDITNSVKLYDVIQYEPYTLTYAVYNPKHLEYIPVEIYLNDVLQTTVNAPNNKELTYSFNPSKSGNAVIKFKYDDYYKIINADVENTVMDLQEIENNLVLNLSASGRTNQDTNKDSWTYGDYYTVFNGFNWSSVSGWNDNRLVLSSGMSITSSIKPLNSTSYGKTIELEFETFNVTDDNTVVCDLRNNQGLGLLITASYASLKVGFGEKEEVCTNYKADENVRISFVLDSINKLAIIYVNGIMSGAVAITSNLSVNKNLSFIGSSTAGIKIKQIRIYDTQLSSEQILNNYILYRDTISEIKDLYNKNDIVDGRLISIEKVSDYVPVILLTGEEIFWLEAQKDTDIEIKIDVEYINKQDPTHQFKFYGGCCRIQGTSSAGYVRKNWRIYSKRKDKFVADAYDWQGVPVNDSKRRIAFKEGAVPVNCWTLKADFAESSGTHNTGVATMWNDVMFNAYHTTEGYVCRTNAQKAALDNNYKYDCRTTVDGFPIVVFARRNDKEDYTFMGKYNFNNDKSTENVFGFCDIPGFDDTYIPGHDGEVIPEGEMNAGKEYTYGNKMQCWEVRENSDPYALFRTTEGWYDPQLNDDGSIKLDEDKVVIRSWASGFEARYPDDGNEADISDLKAFADWIVNCTQERFATEKYDHFDLWKMAAYYIYLMRFGAVDQVVKNSMFTSEDGKHWYFINYDNDTILGLDNSGNLIFPPTITRETKNGATYAYAGHDSRMWNMLEADVEFMTYYVPQIDSILFSGGLKYENALKYFNVNQSDKWCEKIYNEDATYKYIKPYTAGTVNELVKMHGSRKAHRTWWLSKRFQLMDAKFNNSNYSGNKIQLKLEGAKGASFTIKAADYMYFGCEYNKNTWAMGIELNKGESYTFYKASAEEDSVNGKDFSQGDPIYIYSPLHIEELDLSKISSYIYVLEFGDIVNETTSPMMKKLIIGGNKSAMTLSSLSGLNMLTNLEYLDVTGIDYHTIDVSKLLMLKTLILTDSKVNTLYLPEGCMIEKLYLNEYLRELNCHSFPNLTIDTIIGFDTYHIPSINISNSPALTNSFGTYAHWIDNAKPGDSLTLSGLNWTVNPAELMRFGEFKDKGGKLSLKGKITIGSDPTIEQVERLQEIFGENCFTNNAELWISAPESVFVHGPQVVRSGDSQVYTTTIFSENPGKVEWQIESGAQYVESLISNPDNTGTLTTIESEEEDHVIVIKAIHKPANETEDSYWKISTHQIVAKKVIYPTEGTISGNASIQKLNESETFRLTLGPKNYNGDYKTTWLLNGKSFNDGSIIIENATNDSCDIKYIKKVIFDPCTLIAKVETNTVHEDNAVFTVSLPITVTDESVLMTSISNPEVMAICYAQGRTVNVGGAIWCESPDVMYKTEAQSVTDIGEAFRGGSASGIVRPGANIKSFNELEEFKNIKSIPDYAFFQCNNLSSIKIPIGVKSIGTFAFGSTKIKEIEISANVESIYYTSFESSPIESFKVNSSNINYLSKNGVLVSYDGTLIKYPEGNVSENYITDPSVTKINQWAFRNSKLKSLTLSDNVTSYGSNFIVDNTYLETLTIGSNIAPDNIAMNISGNKALTNIHVSENHQSLCSVNGVVYDISKKTLWKYPEGRSEFIIENTVTNVNKYAASICSKFTTEFVVPDHIEYVDINGFYALQNITGIRFNDTSRLTTLLDRAFQLASKAEYIILPASLQHLGTNALGSCYKVSNITFKGNTAPNLANTVVFGSNSDEWTGRDAKSRIMYIPSISTGYDSDMWTNSILSPYRKYVKNDIEYDCTFTLSKTL